MNKHPKKHDEEILTTQDTGNGNPPPKDPPLQPSQPPSTQSIDDDTGNGNPPPKG